MESSTARAFLTACLLAAMGSIPFAAAQDFPNHPVKIVVPWPPGGNVDFTARTMQNAFSDALGQPVVVDNKPGAGGTIGGNEVARSAPDGYTLMLSNSTPLSIGPFTIPKQPYDPVKQFTHVAMLGIAPVA
ncbi:MAG TPA: tripartite tricarboxylate transporter substrate-binding protein, partial [Burkholderiales bacterium]|nr:tripartite tricarboxylate transporter substrate-binding protein [Burkholderiales bacterium]